MLLSIATEETHRKVFPEAFLQMGSVVLRTYTGEPMVVEGHTDVQVKYTSKS